MLLELSIRNVAIIEEISISLKSGLIAFTGETGAGKSILIESLLLALGGRSTVEIVRTGTSEAEVTALLSCEEDSPVKAKLEEAGIPFEDEILVRRVIYANGRSRAYINDRPVTVSFLRAAGKDLVEISGQHEHQHLMNSKYHLDLLDLHGGLMEDRAGIREQYKKTRDMRKVLTELGGNAVERQRRKEYLLYQIEELERVDLSISEDDLHDERRYLLQLERMLEVGQSAEAMLYSGQGSFTEEVGRFAQQFGDWSDFSEELKVVSDGLHEAQALIDDVARSLRNFLDITELNPGRLEEIEEQITQIRDLKRKHGVMTVDALLQTKQEYEKELQQLHDQETLLSEKEAQYNDEVESLVEISTALSKRRRKVATKLSKEIEKELASVGMKKSRFVVEFEYSEPEEGEEALEEDRPLPGPDGQDKVQFLLSSNPGEEPRSLARVASGGELSRIMLSLKQILTEHEPVETCIFDEVDTGIGGFAATIIGQKIKRIADERQVICITHLPQLACFADHHFLIQKSEKDGRTHSVIRKLNKTQREKELARMLGGIEITTQSRAHARQLLQQAKEFFAQA